MSRSVIVEADGGSRGNPGPAGYGALVRDAATGEVLREVAASIGVASNNVAEYRGLIAGLEAALELGADDVEVRMDSLLVVNQMSSVWKVKHEAMKPLASEAAALVRRLPRVRFVHVRREFNSHADRLANEAMDAAAAGRVWTASSRADPAPAGRVSADVATAETAASAATSSRVGWGAPRGRATTTWLLRHGETPLSVEKRFSGSGDPELTERGRQQAEAAAARLAAAGVTAVVTSPRQRAQQTAEAVAKACGVDLVVEPDLAETDFGVWEGRTFAEIADEWPAELAAWRADPAIAPPGGESFLATFARVRAARARVVASHSGGTVVVVSHVTPIKAWVRDALDAPDHLLFRVHL
ncbi:MAG: bifunctional RNase H/acid phosphatase, partial [Frankiales bacterium]|nr:bifunctional RNase H/acid phosphatase [Frankiales bacterium]